VNTNYCRIGLDCLDSWIKVLQLGTSLKITPANFNYEILIGIFWEIIWPLWSDVSKSIRQRVRKVWYNLRDLMKHDNKSFDLFFQSIAKKCIDSTKSSSFRLRPNLLSSLLPVISLEWLFNSQPNFLEIMYDTMRPRNLSSSTSDLFYQILIHSKNKHFMREFLEQKQSVMNDSWNRMLINIQRNLLTLNDDKIRNWLTLWLCPLLMTESVWKDADIIDVFIIRKTVQVYPEAMIFLLNLLIRDIDRTISDPIGDKDIILIVFITRELLKQKSWKDKIPVENILCKQLCSLISCLFFWFLAL